MPNYNKVLLMGNITRDIEMRYTPSGMAVAQLGLAINRKFRDSKSNEMREEVTFVDVELWGKRAETAHQYLAKGQPVFLEGRLKLDQWDDKQTGQKRSKLKVVADTFEFVSTRQGGGGGPPAGGGGNKPASRPAAGGRKAPPAPTNDSGGDDMPPEDLDIQEENIPF